jgi:hypothetical protein
MTDGPQLDLRWNSIAAATENPGTCSRSFATASRARSRSPSMPWVEARCMQFTHHPVNDRPTSLIACSHSPFRK